MSNGKLPVLTTESNENSVEIGQTTLFFSYRTCIGYESPNTGRRISENVWSQTTGRYINRLMPDKSKRIPYPTLQKELKKLKLSTPPIKSTTAQEN